MSNSNRWRVAALALLCASSGVAVAGKPVDVQPQSFPLATSGKSAVKAPLAPMASPVVFSVEATLDEHGHVKAECHEHANPKFDATRNVRERGVVQEKKQ